MKETILCNFIAAAQLAKLKHIFLVIATATATVEKEMNNEVLRKVIASGIPFTCIQIPSKLIDRSSNGFTYQDGIIDKDITIEFVMDITIDNSKRIDNNDKSSIYREDVAAICVQAIQSCDWLQPQRFLTVVVPTAPPVVPTRNQPQQRQENEPSSPLVVIPKRMDQLWCMNAHILEEQLNRLP